MAQLANYPVNTSLISCAANRSYQTRKETRYLILHETVSEASARQQLAYFNGGDRGANAHGFIDWTEVLLTLPLEEVGWHVGAKANGFTEGYELCHASNRADFAKQWESAIWWFARRCAAYGRGAEMILSHHEVSQRFGGTDHTDPDEYFAAFGKSVEEFRREVQNVLDALAGVNVAPVVPVAPPTPKLESMAVEEVIALFGAMTRTATRENLVALNYGANFARRAVGKPITEDLGVPTREAAGFVADKLAGVLWKLTDRVAVQEVLHEIAECLRGVY